MFLFDFFLVLVRLMLIIISSPESFEWNFLLSFNLNLNVRGLEWTHNLNENCSVDYVTGLVEGEFCLNLNLPLGEVASFVTEVQHLFKF